MGWCHEFGPQIRPSCDHPMSAGPSSCSCPECDVVCEGRFAGCAGVWARGPRTVTLARPRLPEARRRATTSVRDRVDAEVQEPVIVDDGRREVLEWLQGAFDGVRRELTALSDAVARQQAALAEVAHASAATARLAELVEALPGRVGAAVSEAVRVEVADQEALRAANGAPAGVRTAAVIGDELRDALPGVVDSAVREIVRPGQGAMLNRVDEMAAELRSSLADVHAAATDLRSEIARLAAFREALATDQPSLAHAVDQATERANGRLTTLAGKMESLTARPEWDVLRSRLPFRREQAPER